MTSSPAVAVPPPPPTAWLPAGFRVALDRGTRRIEGGTVLVGGTPLRLLRLTAAGVSLVDRLEQGHPVPTAEGPQRLARRLLGAGMAHPRPSGTAATAGDVTVVVPVLDRADGLARTLARLGPVGRVIVVDDGSEGDAVAQTATAAGAAVVRHDRTQGPAAARNTGWRAASTPLVAFLDADCEPEPGWLPPLVAHFDDVTVAAVAPRLVATPAGPRSGLVARYEADRPSLDRGGLEATVRPRSIVPFVPTAALVVRRACLEASGGFDEGLRVGEDVDFVWRLATGGWTVRYEAAVTVAHPPRATVAGWLRQRVGYGSAAAPLARRHGRAVAPLALSPWSALAWTFVGAGFPLAGLGVAVASTALLAPRLGGLTHPWREAARLAGTGHLAAGRLIAEVLRRPWWPVLAAAAVLSPQARRVAVAVAVVAPLDHWQLRRPGLHAPARFALSLADDAAYGLGVWLGCLGERSLAALAPDLVSWSGSTPAVEASSGPR